MNKCEYYYEKKIGVNPEEYPWNMPDYDDKSKQQTERAKKKYGFDSSEVWDLDYTFIAWVYPRLKMLKEVQNAHPVWVTKEEYDKEVDEMINGFETYLMDDTPFSLKEEREKVNRSLDLFKKYFWDLWC